MNTQVKSKAPEYAGRGWPGVRKEAAGFFRVTQVNGTWWIIDPNGSAFFIVGTDHVRYTGHSCEKLGYSPYHKNCVAKFGSEALWAADTADRLQTWGFNALGVAHSESMRHRGLPHPIYLGMGVGFAAIDSIPEKTWWTGFPNVFSPKFADHCAATARRMCAPLKNDPWLLGYFIDNELQWDGRMGAAFGSLLTDAVAKDAGEPSRIAAVKLLRSRHRTIASFNRAWGTKARGFEELARFELPMTSVSQAALDDAEAFKQKCADEYYRITTETIRSADSNHMVLGNRFAGEPGPIWEIAGKYCDIISVNCYRSLDLDREKFSDGFEDLLDGWFERCKRPMMITEWSFPAMDTDRPCASGAGQRVSTQRERARAFSIFQRFLFSKPFMVGSDFFMWTDEPAEGISKSFPEDSNYGLVNERDEPYSLLVETALTVNTQVYALHSGMTGKRVFASISSAKDEIDLSHGADFVLTIENQTAGRFTGRVDLEVVCGGKTGITTGPLMDVGPWGDKVGTHAYPLCPACRRRHHSPGIPRAGILRSAVQDNRSPPTEDAPEHPCSRSKEGTHHVVFTGRRRQGGARKSPRTRRPCTGSRKIAGVFVERP